MLQTSTKGYDRVGKLIPWELCKILNFGHITNWTKQMNKTESFLENDTNRLPNLDQKTRPSVNYKSKKKKKKKITV